MNFPTYKFRCHSLGKLMTSLNEDKLPVGAITQCHIIHREMTWNRRSEIKSKYLKKGHMREEDAITMVSLHEKKLLNKNKERIENDYFTGEPDLYIGKSIREATEGWDTKCSWDWTTFPYPNEKIDTLYGFQDLAYMDLTGARKWHTVHCLVNTPLPLLNKEIKNAKYRIEDEWGPVEIGNIADEKYTDECCKIERNHIVDMASFMKEYPDYTPFNHPWTFDIPRSERMIYQTVEWDQEKMDKVYKRLDKCRDFMSKI